MEENKYIAVMNIYESYIIPEYDEDYLEKYSSLNPITEIANKIANNKLFPNIIAANVIITKITALLNLTQNI